jgi:hypothetical protein
MSNRRRLPKRKPPGARAFASATAKAVTAAAGNYYNGRNT